MDPNDNIAFAILCQIETAVKPVRILLTFWFLLSSSFKFLLTHALKISQLTLLVFFPVSCTICISYAQQPTLEWVSRYPDTNAIFSATSSALVLDDSGNVYITGNSGATSQSYFTTKYSSSGKQLWISNFLGTLGVGYPRAIALDKASNVYVTGVVNNGSTYFDYCTVKYNSNGVQQWFQYYNGPISGDDEAEKIAVDNAGNVYVSGFSQITGQQGYTYATIKYSVDGRQLWTRTFPELNSAVYVHGLAVDDNCNIYVTGEFGVALTVKYDSSGNQQWFQKYFEALPGISSSNSIKLDKYDNVYVTGYTEAPFPRYRDYFTIKYSIEGLTQWVKTYNSDTLSNRSRYEANAIEIDNSQNIYISGFYMADQGATRYFCTIKYANDGALIWVNKRTDTLANENTFMDLDASANIYLLGEIARGSAPNHPSSTIIKLDSSGTMKWNISYINPIDQLTLCAGIQIDVNNDVISSGTGFSVNHSAMFIVKYSQPVGIKFLNSNIPEKYEISQNYPNPFNPKTIIKFYIPQSGFIKIKMFDLLGRELLVPVNNKFFPGEYYINFDGTYLSSGIYFYSLFVDEKLIDTKKMVILK